MIDFERLRLHVPEIRYDLPAGGRRLVQRVDGYIATLVSGTPVFEHGAVHRRDTQAGWCARDKSRLTSLSRAREEGGARAAQRAR